ncbi:MAG: DUF523 domain-containing protein [Oscillospiraceae bacterium]
MARERLLISACLLGVFCKYDGSRKAQPWVSRLLERYELIPVCPEVLGGLPTPRPPAERRGDRVVTQAGGDVTDAYATGAAETLRLAELYGCTRAILKERSPSCGAGACYDGSFTHTCVPRDGVTAELLRAHGITVLGESQAETL